MRPDHVNDSVRRSAVGSAGKIGDAAVEEAVHALYECGRRGLQALVANLDDTR